MYIKMTPVRNSLDLSMALLIVLGVLISHDHVSPHCSTVYHFLNLSPICLDRLIEYLLPMHCVSLLLLVMLDKHILSPYLLPTITVVK